MSFLILTASQPYFMPHFIKWKIERKKESQFRAFSVLAFLFDCAYTLRFECIWCDIHYALLSLSLSHTHINLIHSFSSSTRIWFDSIVEMFAFLFSFDVAICRWWDDEEFTFFSFFASCSFLHTIRIIFIVMWIHWNHLSLLQHTHTHKSDIWIGGDGWIIHLDTSCAQLLQMKNEDKMVNLYAGHDHVWRCK